MNILFVDQFDQPAGAQRCLLDLLPGLTGRGWNCAAALPPGAGLSPLLESLGAEVHRIACGPYSNGDKTAADYVRFPFDTLRTAAALRRVVSARGADLIYANGPRVAAAASLCGVPMVFHAHSRLSRPHDLWVMRFALRNAHVIAAAQAVARPLQDFCRPRIIYSGTEDLGFRPWSPCRALRIGVIGRISPEKGQLLFVEAVRALAPEAPHCRFVVCGDALLGGSSYARSVRETARDLPITFHGWKDDPAGAFREIDLLVVPSGPDEGAPRVILEAFSAGIPVVASRSGAIGELVQDGQTGFLFPSGSAGALAGLLLSLVHSQERLAAVAAGARRSWERDFTVGRYRGEIIQFLEFAAGRSRIQKSIPAAAPTTPADPSRAG